MNQVDQLIESKLSPDKNVSAKPIHEYWNTDSMYMRCERFLKDEIKRRCSDRNYLDPGVYDKELERLLNEITLPYLDKLNDVLMDSEA